MPDPLHSLLFNDLDRHFARFIGRFGKEGSAGALDRDWLPIAAACLSRAVRQGHICLSLATPPAEWPKMEKPCPTWPTLAEWRQHLAGARALTLEPQSSLLPTTPLVLDAGGRLYLARYYAYEQSLAEALLQRVGPLDKNGAPFPEGQEAALEAALSRPFLIISGGPGTGKTTTLVKILTRLLTEQPELRIALAAPTGKAAARMEEAIRNDLQKDPALQALADRFPRARTLDGLLGTRPMKVRPAHNAAHPLPVDLLVVDEASMVALPLMAKLFAALPLQARVLLLGDRDQLASVAPGNVLGDLAEAAMEPGSPLAGTLAMLRTNYRFGNESTIYRLSEAVRTGDAAAVLALAQKPKQGQEPPHADFAFQDLPPPAALVDQLRPLVLEGYRPYLCERSPAAALEAFARFRLLCAVRQGAYGVEGVNRAIEGILREAGLIAPRTSQFYAGLPILVTRNDDALWLRNGDIGILLPDPDALVAPEGFAPLWAWFPSEAGPRRLAPSRLPEFETAFAMTIHKSQGSEFQRVLLLLPDHDLPILTRELIYTGLTRARSHVALWAKPELLAGGITRQTGRHTGLKEMLERLSQPC